MTEPPPDDILLARVKQLAVDHTDPARGWYCNADHEGLYCCIDYLLADDPAKLLRGDGRELGADEVPEFEDLND